MNTFFDRMRSGAGKAAFEADKLRRITLIQAELRGLRDDLQKAVAQAGQVAFSLHQRGQIAQPELRAVCEAAAAVLAHVAAQEAEIERIRAEQFVESHAADDAGLLLCPVGHGPLPAGARFCQHCGQPGVASAAGSPVAPAVAAQRCPSCGEGLAADAHFCANCGLPITPAAPPPPAPPASPPRQPSADLPATVRLGGGKPAAATAARCPSCGQALDKPDLAYCNTCGFPLKPETA